MNTSRALVAVVGLVSILIVAATSRAAVVAYSESFEGTISGSIAGNVSLITEPAYFGQATDGVKYLAFNPAETTINGTFTSSNFATLSGETYTLTFDYGRFNDSGSGPQSMTVSVTDTVTVSTLTLSPSGSISDSSGTTAAGLVMSPFTLTFTGSGNPVFLKFADTTANGFQSDGLFDHVVVTYVPEPASLGLLGVFGLLALRRRLACA